MNMKILLFALLIGSVLALGDDEDPDTSYEIRLNKLRKPSKPKTTKPSKTTKPPITTKPPKETAQPPKRTTEPPKRTTEPPKATTRPTTTTPSPGAPTCPVNKQENHPHHTCCNLYYDCVNGIAYLRECPAGLHYDPALKVCAHPNAVNCQLPTQYCSYAPTARWGSFSSLTRP